MASGEILPPPGNHEPYRQETIELILHTVEDDDLHLNYDNTTVRLYRENSDVNCVEIHAPHPDDPTKSLIHRLFEREDLTDALTYAGFRTVSERYAPDDVVDIYVAWLTENLAVDYELLDSEGTTIIPNPTIPETFADIPRSTPVVELPLANGETFRASYENTGIFVFTQRPEMSHIFIRYNNAENGEVVASYLFEQPELLQGLVDAKFPVTRQEYPSASDVVAFQRWFEGNLDFFLAETLGRNESESDGDTNA